jgi:hypothetical protein
VSRTVKRGELVREWCVLTVDLKKVPPDSSLRVGRRGRSVAQVENVVFFVPSADLAALAADSEAGSLTAFEYDLVDDQLHPRALSVADVVQAGEIYHAHPSLITARPKLIALDDGAR